MPCGTRSSSRSCGSKVRRRWSISPIRTDEPSDWRPAVEREPAEQRLQQRCLARAVVALDQHPVAPVQLQAHGPEPEGTAHDHGIGEHGDDLTAARRRAEAEPQLPLLARLGYRFEPVDRAQCGGSPGGLALRALDHAAPDVLVGLLAPHRGALRGAFAGASPLLLAPRPLHQLVPAGRVRLVGLCRPGLVPLEFLAVGR